MKLFFLGILITNLSFAWTLNNNFGAVFKDNHVNVYVDETTTCAGNSMQYFELQALIRPAIDQYWNNVPTANIRLDDAGYSDPVTNINSGRLCSPTDTTCIDSSPGNVIPATTDIIIACNSNPANFGGGNVLAVTVPVKFSGKKITGAIILVNDNSTTFGNLSHSDKVAVIAHEIGDALGLGHSPDNASLMYYRTVNQRKRLGQDDVDGISFLYPMHGDLFGLSEDGLLGSCGTISGDKDPPQGFPPVFQMGSTLGIVLLFLKLLKLLNRSKASSST